MRPSSLERPQARIAQMTSDDYFEDAAGTPYPELAGNLRPSVRRSR